MKYAVKFGTVVTAAALTLAGCVLGGGEADPAKLETTIKIMAPSYSEETRAGWETAIKEYQKVYPKVKVELHIGDWQVYASEVKKRLASKDYPDILNDNNFAAMAENKLLYPISEVMSWGTINSIEPALLKNGLGVDGTQWAAPDVASSRLLAYNTGIFDRASIMTPPSTWEQLGRACAKIQVAAPDVYAYGMPLGEEEAQVETSGWVRGAKGSWTINHELTFDSPGVQAAFTQMKALVDKGCTQPDPGNSNRQDVSDLFKQGKIGMMVTYSGVLTEVARLHPEVRYDVVPIPSKDGTGFSVGVTDFMMAFNNGDEARKQATKGFLDIFYSDIVYRKWYVSTNLLPVTRNIIAESKAKADSVSMKFYDALSSVKFLPANNPRWGALQHVLQSNAGKIVTEEPAKSVKALQSELNSKIQKK